MADGTNWMDSKMIVANFGTVQFQTTRLNLEADSVLQVLCPRRRGHNLLSRRGGRKGLNPGRDGILFSFLRNLDVGL
jgi:hypothetical protein